MGISDEVQVLDRLTSLGMLSLSSLFSSFLVPAEQTSSFKSRVPKLPSKVVKFNVNYMTLDTPKINTTFEDNFGIHSSACSISQELVNPPEAKVLWQH